MRAIRKKNNYFFKLSEEVYDLDGNEYLWKDLILCPEDDEQVNYRLEQLEIEKLRQEYAGMAMQALISNKVYLNYMATKAKKESDTPEELLVTMLSKDAVQFADALIEELRKGEK